MKEFKLAYIKWADSYGVGSSWEGIDGLKDEVHYCHSVGWLVKEGKNVLILVPHLSLRNKSLGSNSTGCGDMSIPVSAIVDIQYLDIREPLHEE